jgi:hypothetical protein
MQREFFTTKHAKATKNGKVWFVLIRFSSFVNFVVQEPVAFLAAVTPR